MAVIQHIQTENLSTKRVSSYVEIQSPNRREFLYYIWNASMLMLLGEFVGIGLWFAYPRFRADEFGGTFTFNTAEIPSQQAAPVSMPSGRLWISHSSEGFLALYAVCTHLGCLPKWVATNMRFECPCHGSKFELNGKYIEGPAPRSLDRFRTTIVFTNGDTVTTNDRGDPISLEAGDIADIRIDTGDRILRNGRI